MEIVWSRRSLKQLLKLKDHPTIKMIKDTVGAELYDYENSNKVKALKNHKYQYRLRAGQYRVLFDVEDELKIIAIEEVKKRDERTY
ncbi:mRNA interferase RelE/StbE [uncultured Thiomicrorhabdus sp.]